MVVGIEKLEESVGVENTAVESEEGDVREVLRCDKLIVATETSSTPSFPDNLD